MPNGFRRISALGHKRPRRSKAGAAALPPITDTKAKDLHGRAGSILAKLNTDPPVCSPPDMASALDVIAWDGERDVFRNIERNGKFQTCSRFRNVAHGATENGTLF
jgi:hypothetical protein